MHVFGNLMRDVAVDELGADDRQQVVAPLKLRDS
jgi:hypothetical protein